MIVLNTIDIMRRSGDKFDPRKMGDALGCEVTETSALRGEGSVEHALAHIENMISHHEGELHHHHADGIGSD